MLLAPWSFGLEAVILAESLVWLAAQRLQEEKLVNTHFSSFSSFGAIESSSKSLRLLVFPAFSQPYQRARGVHTISSQKHEKRVKPALLAFPTLESLKVHQQKRVFTSFPTFPAFLNPISGRAGCPHHRLRKKPEKLVNTNCFDELPMTPKLEKLEGLVFTSFSCFCEDMVWTQRVS